MASNTADARLDFAMRQAIEDGDMPSFISVASQRYARMVERGGSSEDRTELRAAISSRTDELRGSMRSRVGRLWAGDVTDGACGLMLRDLFSQDEPDPAAALNLAETAKARTLLDWMTGHFSELPPQLAVEVSGIERKLTRFEDDVLHDLAYTELKLSSELSLGQQERSIDVGALRDAEDIYADADAGFSGIALPPPLEQIAAELSSNELLVEYVIPSHGLHPASSVTAVAIHAGGARIIRLPLESLGDNADIGFIGSMMVDGRAPIDASPLGNALVNLRVAIQKGEDSRCEPWLRVLHDVLIEPLRQAGLDPARFAQLTIVPHRQLHVLPWAALTAADGHRLIEDCALTFAPSAAVWLALRRKGNPVVTNALALANPLLSYLGLPALPHAAEEARQVADTLQGLRVSCDVRCDEVASETALLQHGAGCGIVYLATHGQFPENDAIDFHQVLLARTRHDSGVVTADTVRRLDLRSTWLVVLSVCDGGLTRIGPGDEPQGLVPAFLIAGARNVISTLWEIDDKAGRDLMVAAAPHLLSEGPAGALQRAVRSAARDGNVPIRDWAGFVCAGSSQPAGS